MTDPRCTHVYPGGEQCSLDAETHAIPGVARRHGYPPTEAVVIPELCTPPEKWATAFAAPTPARVALTDDDQANDCTHGSASGIDTTPVTDPAKVWRCDHCGLRWSDTSPLRHTAADLAAREAVLRAQIETEIETEYEGRAGRGLVTFGYEEGYLDGLDHAARIAGGDA